MNTKTIIIATIFVLSHLLFTELLFAADSVKRESKSSQKSQKLILQNPFLQELQPELIESLTKQYEHLGEGFREDLYVRYFLQGVSNANTHTEQLKRAQWIFSKLGKDGFSRSFFVFFKFYLNLIQGEKISAFSLGQQIFQSGFLNRLTPPDLEKFSYEFNRIGSEARFQIPPDLRFSLDSWGLPTRKDLEQAAAQFLALRYFRDQMNRHDNAIKNSFYRHLYKSFFHSSNINIGLSSEDKQPTIDQSFSKNYRNRRRARAETQNSHRNPFLSLALVSTKAAFRDALGNFQKFLALKQEAYLWELDEDTKTQHETLEKILEIHPTSATHLKLAEYYRNERDWTKMNLHNNQALNLSPNAITVEAPLPEITKLNRPILSNTVLSEIEESFQSSPEDLRVLLKRRKWLKKHPSFLNYIHLHLESKLKKEQLQGRIEYSLVLLNELGETQQNYITAKLLVFMQLAKLWNLEESLVDQWRSRIREYIHDPSLLELL